MTELAIIGTTMIGAGTGFSIGFWLGLREGGDLNFAPVMYAPMGGLVGALIGAIIGPMVFV